MTDNPHMAEHRDPDVLQQVEDFLAPLDQYPAQPVKAIIDAVEYVASEGSSARRPVLGEIVLEPDYREFIPVFGHRLREIRPLGTYVRILCIFSPDRTLVLLFAGDKEGDWNGWYRRAIPEAARLYREYLKEMGLQ